MRSAVLLLVCAVCCCGLLHSSAAAPRAAPRAAPSPFQSQVSGGYRPDNQRHGSWDVTASRTKGVGTAVHTSGQGDAWVSRDGNSRVRVGGHYDRVVHGPAKGAKDYGGHITYEKKF